MDNFEDDLTRPVRSAPPTDPTVEPEDFTTNAVDVSDSSPRDSFDDDQTIMMNRTFRKVSDPKPPPPKANQSDPIDQGDALSQQAERTIGKVATASPVKTNAPGTSVWVPPARPNAPGAATLPPQRKPRLAWALGVVTLIAVVIVFFIVFQLTGQ